MSSTKIEIPPELIQKFLDEKGMTPKELAELLNVSEPTVYRWLPPDPSRPRSTDRKPVPPTGTAAAVLASMIAAAGLLPAASIIGRGVGLSLGASLLGGPIGMVLAGAGIGYSLYKALRSTFEEEAQKNPEVMKLLEKAAENHEARMTELQTQKELRRQLDEARQRIKDLESQIGEDRASGPRKVISPRVTRWKEERIEYGLAGL